MIRMIPATLSSTSPWNIIKASIHNNIGTGSSVTNLYRAALGTGSSAQVYESH